ncbi:hypothetical protein DL762_007836 [Monosporascus cannonballus]|uniref:Uncharacterized protein n=1 Tax=Monosporascus cannonballus TaxID=155416 RepID=A0ABY0GY33_9PEZI|nr:hypothetical protein DL762_007836 [Monosporascus cannonballus]
MPVHTRPQSFSEKGQPDWTDAKVISEHFLQTKEESWAETMKVNVTGLYWMSMAFLPLLQKVRDVTPRYTSQIVNITSISGAMKGSSSGQPAYAASKAAATHLSRMLATLFTDTKRDDGGLLGREDNKSKLDMKASNPAGRFGHDSDMAATILFLAGKGGLLYNGQILTPDGGKTLRSIT